jgi:hypothetical protein
MKKKIFFKNCNLLKREHLAHEKMKFINFFLCLCVIFALLDPDPDADPGTLNPDLVRGIRILIRFHSTANEHEEGKKFINKYLLSCQSFKIKKNYIVPGCWLSSSL